MDSMKDYAKPLGEDGEKLLDSMDIDHSPRALWSLPLMNIKEDDIIVDIGCGSGLNLKRLHELSYKAKSYGVDYSSTCVKKATIMNQEEVDKDNIIIKEANVLDMPFDDETFDVATAFSTVFFWPDILDSFKEVKRTLKTGGRFIMVHGMDTDSDEKIEDDIFTSYTTDDFKQLLADAEYSHVTIITRNHSENKRTVTQIDGSNVSEEVLDDDYINTYNDNEIRTNQEWICIIAEK